jgi:hypothetical protein
MGIVLWQLVSKVLFPASDALLENPHIYRVESVPGVPKWFEVSSFTDPKGSKKREKQNLTGVLFHRHYTQHV